MPPDSFVLDCALLVLSAILGVVIMDPGACFSVFFHLPVHYAALGIFKTINGLGDVPLTKH